MVQKALNSILSGKKFLCIEVLMQEDKTHYHVIEVWQKNNSLAIDSSSSYIGFDALMEQIPKDRPTLLSFTGQGIISKKIANTGNYRSNLLFNANPDDFYWYELVHSEHVYASVARKSVIDNELEAFNKNQVFVVDISIGPFVISTIKPLLPDVSSLFSRNFKLDFQNNKISGVAKLAQIDHETSYDIDGETITTKNIVSFATLVQYLFPNTDIDFEKDFLEPNREELRYRKAFNTTGMVALPGFLIALFVSYLLLSHYQQAYIDLQVSLEEENIAYNKLVLLENDRDNKEAILNESGLNDSNFLSHYLSEITKEVPSEINLITLYIFSPTTKIKPGQRILFNNDEVEITGETSSNDAFANWIKAIKEYPWIENLEIVDFRKEGTSSNFEIRLKLKFNV
ncbi:PilN domain-containing protein [Flavobacteriaceae bacterium TP-CH-4]|uniref:PilN domain-containing protein n=1 Tax=Pelagihabitans pacificus TaxID=2696054 RepID=A0A967ARE5_9FLAO|nr:hypothetical protein [Pelagihabitans pacificus]NHF58994.1 PilN domain-containing protein [Pelagihabitans pacificus]